MNHQNRSESLWPISWKRGLRNLAVFYVGVWIVTFALQLVKNAVASVDVRIAAIDHDGNEARLKRDLAGMRAAGDRLEEEVKNMQFLRSCVFSIVGFLALWLILLVVGTFQITKELASIWLQLVRYLVFLPWVLMTLRLFGARNDAVQILALFVGLVTFRGHLEAASKIAVKTGNSEIARRLEWTFRAMWWSLVVYIFAPFLPQEPVALKSIYTILIWTGRIGITVATSALVVSLGVLSSRLRAAR